jgi:hypothetical protein
MDRANLIFRKYPSQVLLALGILLGAIILFAACLTSLAAAAPNKLGMFAGGQVKQTNSSDLASILNVHGMLPGQVARGTVVIANDGDATELFSLSAAVTDTANAAGAQLSQVLQLKVTDVTDQSHPRVVFRGLLTGLSDAAAGSIAAGHSRTYLFTVTFPSGADDRFAGSSLAVEFDWTAVQ